MSEAKMSVADAMRSVMTQLREQTAENNKRWRIQMPEQLVPKGFVELKNVDAVFVSDYGEIVVLGMPKEGDDHNCDYMGCGSLDHVILRAKMTDIRFG